MTLIETMEKAGREKLIVKNDNIFAIGYDGALRRASKSEDMTKFYTSYYPAKLTVYDLKSRDWQIVDTDLEIII